MLLHVCHFMNDIYSCFQNRVQRYYKFLICANILSFYLPIPLKNRHLPRNKMHYFLLLFFNYFIIATHEQGGSWYLSPHAWYLRMYGRLTTINYCKSWYHIFTPKMHYFTKISTLECIILRTIRLFKRLILLSCAFQTYFLVSGKRENRCNINFRPRKLAYLRIFAYLCGRFNLFLLAHEKEQAK